MINVGFLICPNQSSATLEKSFFPCHRIRKGEGARQKFQWLCEVVFAIRVCDENFVGIESIVQDRKAETCKMHSQLMSLAGQGSQMKSRDPVVLFEEYDDSLCISRP